MTEYVDDSAPRPASDAITLGEETELVRRAGSGDEEAFGLLYDRYFARVSWYFTIFARRKAKSATAEVLRALFGSLGEPSDLSFAERAYRLARATELRHTAVPAKVESTPEGSVPKVETT